MSRLIKKCLSFILVCAMLFALLPLAVFAVEGDELVFSLTEPVFAAPERDEYSVPEESPRRICVCANAPLTTACVLLSDG